MMLFWWFQFVYPWYTIGSELFTQLALVSFGDYQLFTGSIWSDSLHGCLDVFYVEQSGPSHNQIIYTSTFNIINPQISNSIIIIMLKITKYFRTFSNIKQAQPIRKKPVSGRRISLLGMTAFLTYLIFHHRKSEGQVTYMMHDTTLNKEIIRNNPLLNRDEYMPALFLPFSALQMFYAKFFETRTNIKYEKRQVVEACVLDYMAKATYVICEATQDKNRDISNRPCIIIVDGSEGSNQLLKTTMLNLSSNSFDVISIDMDDIFDTNKLTRIITQIKQQRKGVNFHGLGIEYGANLLVIAAANNSELFKSIMLIGNPFDLNKAQKKAEDSILAKLTFLNSIKKARIQKSKLKIPINTPLSELTKQIYKIPSEQQAHQFKQKNSSINFIPNLKTPALFLNSKQDPFSIDISNDQRIQSNPNAIFVSTKSGGHNQWFQSLNVTRYAPRLAVLHFKTIQMLMKKQAQLLREQPVQTTP